MELNPEQVKAIQKLIWEEKCIVYSQVKGKGYCHIKKNKRFKTLVFSGSGSKNYLKQFLAYEPEYKCIAQILNFKGYRQFMPFRSWDECWDLYKTTGYNHRYLNEVIISNNACKPYLDIEWKDKNIKKCKLDRFIKKLICDVKTIFKNRYKLVLKSEHILITEAHGDDKISFHVVINYVANNVYFAYQTNRKRNDNSAWDLYNALIDFDECYKNVIDESVYTLDREFRAIYSTKYGEHRHLVPINSKHEGIIKNKLDYFVTHFDKNKKIKIIETPKYIHHKFNVIKRVNRVSEIKGDHVQDYKRKDDDKNQDILDRIYELLQFIHPTAYFTNKTQDGNGWRFSYHDKSEVCFTGKTHQHNGNIMDLLYL